MRKLLILLCALLLCSVAEVSAQVSDIRSPWAEESLTQADELGILPDFFSGSDLTSDITRIDFCRLAYKMLTEKNGVDIAEAESKFKDTNDLEVGALANVGIINGRTDTEFAPDDSITREEAAVILTNAAEFMGVKKDIALFDTRFSDFETVSDWAKDAVCKMDSIGIMRGVGDNNFAPKSNYTMEQSAITMLKLFNLNLSDYKENVQEIKIVGDLSLFYSSEEQWIKNKGNLIYTYEAPNPKVDNERTFVFFEKSGGWYFYVLHNKSNTAGYNKHSDIYSAETGEIIYPLKAAHLQPDKGDTIDFADDYYMVVSHWEAGGVEPVSYMTGMYVYSYEGEEIVSSLHSSHGGGDYLNKDDYPGNNRQIRINFEKAESPSGTYFVPGENMLLKYPYVYEGYRGFTSLTERISYNEANTLNGYTPVKLSLPDENGNCYTIFDYNGIPVYKSENELFVMLYTNNLCIGEAKDNTIRVYTAETKEYITTLEWNKDEYDTADIYMYEYLESM